jgi:hypothetical protein
MASLMQWLGKPWPKQLSLPFAHGWRPTGLPDEPTKLHVLAVLVRLGGWENSGYGITTHGGPYGRQGLEQQEAFALWDMRAFIEGVLYATEDAEVVAFKEAIEKEWARVEALQAPSAREGLG